MTLLLESTAHYQVLRQDPWLPVAPAYVIMRGPFIALWESRGEIGQRQNQRPQYIADNGVIWGT